MLCLLALDLLVRSGNSLGGGASFLPLTCLTFSHVSEPEGNTDALGIATQGTENSTFPVFIERGPQTDMAAN